tara:strand:- start:111 stop:431 length:321 start_codon:yes stop_codon:yes gene_type:complete
MVRVLSAALRRDSVGRSIHTRGGRFVVPVAPQIRTGFENVDLEAEIHEITRCGETGASGSDHANALGMIPNPFTIRHHSILLDAVELAIPLDDVDLRPLTMRELGE